LFYLKINVSMRNVFSVKQSIRTELQNEVRLIDTASPQLAGSVFGNGHDFSRL
jgi:hypothetical protein